MALSPDDVQAIVDQLSPAQTDTVTTWIAALLPQAGIIAAVVIAANKRVKKYEASVAQALAILVALDESHKSDESPFAIAPAVALLEGLQKRDEQQHAFNVWAGGALEMIVRKLGQIMAALARHGVNIKGDSDSDTLRLSKPPGE